MALVGLPLSLLWKGLACVRGGPQGTAIGSAPGHRRGTCSGHVPVATAKRGVLQSSRGPGRREVPSCPQLPGTNLRGSEALY